MGDEAQQGKRAALAEGLLPYVLVVLVPFGLTLAPRIFNDGDISWHVAAGQWIAAHRSIPTTDPFSFTAFGKPWVAMEWLADLVLAGAHRLAGFTGLAAVVVAALAALHFALFAHLRRRASPLAIIAALIAMDLALGPFLLARPHVLAWPLVAAWTALLARASETGRPPPWWTALLLTLWCNMHGSFPLAAVIAAPLAYDALVKAEWRTLRQWLLFAAVCLVAICLNANGLAGILQPFRVAQLGTLGLIQEWMPSSPGATPGFYLVLLLTLGAMLWAGVRVPLGRLALLLTLLLLAFTQIRHQSWLAIVAAVLVPPLFATAAGPARRLAPLALAAVVAVVVRLALPVTLPENTANPTRLIAAIPPELRGQPVFNGYSFGGPLILAGIRPYIDGRSEMYGDAFVADYAAIVAGDMAKFNAAVGRYGLRWAMLPAGNAVLIAKLDESGQWRRVYGDDVGVIFVHT